MIFSKTGHVWMKNRACFFTLFPSSSSFERELSNDLEHSSKRKTQHIVAAL